MSLEQLTTGCVLWLCCCSVVSVEGREREKRELRFPKGGSLLAGVALASFFPKGPADGLAHVLEFDLGFSFPEKFTIDRTDNRPQRPIVKFKSKKKFRTKNLEDQRRELLFKMEKTLDRFQLDGSSCVSRFLCELREISSGSSLLEELLSALFEPSTQEDCYRLRKFACPVSLLHLIMHSQHKIDETLGTPH